MDVFQANDSFQFNKLQLSPPQHIIGGSYLTRYSYCNNKQPLYIQTTKTLSKQGIVVSGKKAHIDLVLTSTDADTELLEWMTSLEKRSVELLYEKRHIWFTQELDQTDIENSLASPFRAYKNGNYLLRVNLEPSRNITANVPPFLCKVFDEHKKATTVDYVKAEHSIISIVEFQGIKFTSRNFQIELLLRQVLVIEDVPLFETCLIRDDAPSNAVNVSHSAIPKREHTPEPKPEPEPEPEPERDPEPEQNKDLGLVEQDETEKYTSPQPLKHFEYTEVDIDFKNIPDVIDVNEPVFDVPSSSSATAAASIPKPITLKKHKDVLYEMYKIAKHKACEMKRAAMRAYLEAKEIKAKYLLDDLDDLDSESSDDDTKN